MGLRWEKNDNYIVITTIYCNCITFLQAKNVLLPTKCLKVRKITENNDENRLITQSCMASAKEETAVDGLKYKHYFEFLLYK